MRYCKYIGLILCVFIILLLDGCVSMKGMSLKNKEFVIDVNQKIPKLASNYFEKAEQKDEVTFRKSNVNVKKLGRYQATIAYQNKSYDIDIVVKDRIGPVIALRNSLLVVSLNEKLGTVRDLIKECIMITDNYDTIFPTMNLLKEMPKEEKELVFPIQIMDSSGNISKMNTLHVQFTKSGKKKTDLKEKIFLA